MHQVNPLTFQVSKTDLFLRSLFKHLQISELTHAKYSFNDQPLGSEAIILLASRFHGKRENGHSFVDSDCKKSLTPSRSFMRSSTFYLLDRIAQTMRNLSAHD